ncbi:MAG: hypothetical protein GW917_01185 [Bdellovibrionales bacterium]|nr:hypothetical protein [Bdellovibrionales bacterium]
MGNGKKWRIWNKPFCHYNQHKNQVNKKVLPKNTLNIGEKAGYHLCILGRVEEGERKVIFEPEDITLPPPGE